MQDFINFGYKISILEIYKPNVQYFKNDPRFTEVIEGDVTKFNSKKKYDIVFWWHGPEHIEEEKIKNTLKKLELIAKHFVVLGCPWGDVPQSLGLEKNPDEKHVSFIKTGYFESLKYKTAYSGLENAMGSNIIAVKNVKR